MGACHGATREPLDAPCALRFCPGLSLPRRGDASSSSMRILRVCVVAASLGRKRSAGASPRCGMCGKFSARTGNFLALTSGSILGGPVINDDAAAPVHEHSLLWTLEEIGLLI